MKKPKGKSHWSYDDEKAKLNRWQLSLERGTLRGIDGETTTPKKPRKPNATEQILMDKCNLTLQQVRQHLKTI